MSDWQPIETAPKDGTVVDLWMVDESGQGWRETDAWFVEDTFDAVKNFNPDGSHYYERGNRSGWWAPNQEYDRSPGWCDSPRRFNHHPRQQKWMFIEPTHWMPIPAPPS